MGNIAPRQPVVLVVDDSEDIRSLVVAILGKEYVVKVAADARAGLKLALDKPQPDLILLDVVMPGHNGFEVCKLLKGNPATLGIPVIFLTGKRDVQHEVEGLKLGADDYLSKPINSMLLRQRVRTHLAVANRRHELEALVRERTKQLEDTRLQLIRRLCRAMEYHESSAVGNRVMRLSQYARLIAIHAGAKPQICEMMLKAAPLHDIGKLGVPAEILRRTGTLSEPDWVYVRRHPELGAEIIGEHDDPLLKLARILALTHHERWDGTGYPKKLKGDAIPWPGRVMALVDAFEAMTTTQFHHEPMSFAEAARQVIASAGKQFDPAVVEAFRKAMPEIRKVYATYEDKLGDLINLDFSAKPAKKPAA
ncbi:MAG: response regulator [Betaproteobacteria bacterium]|nr:response regulator [Betaproteobacteria bacterium]